MTPAQNRLENAARSLQIEPRAMDVLLLLARHAGEVVSVNELLTSVWKGAVVGDGSVYLAINQLRRALDDPAQPTRHIQTIPKRGYRLTVPVRYPERTSTHSIAVLPFESSTADAAHAYFADGLTVELLNVMCRVRSLHVAGVTSSFRFKKSKDDLRTIGAALGVDHVLEGNVRAGGDRVRISVRLSETRTHRQLWSQTYERTLADIFAIQDDIARAVADALQITLGVGDLGSTPGMTRNVAAYEEYLKAAALNLEWRADTAARAIEHLERAVALDPAFSVAFALLHAACFNGAGVAAERAAEWRRKGTVALERARALTPDAPDVLRQVAIHEADTGSWLAAGVAFERLWQRDAQHDMAYRAVGSRGIFLLSAGRAKEAVDELEHARATDPFAVAFARFLAGAYLATRNFTAAFAEVDRGLGLAGLRPPLRNVALAAALALRDRSAIERRIAAFTEDDPAFGVHRAMMPLLDERNRARAEIDRLASSSALSRFADGSPTLSRLADGSPALSRFADGSPAPPSEGIALAQWAAYFGEPELALELLAPIVGQSRRPFALWQPLMGDVRKLPAFKRLVQGLGLVDYWRAFGWSDFSRPHRGGEFTCE